MAEQNMVVWAPADNVELNSILAALPRSADLKRRPRSLIFVAFLPASPGVDSTSKLFDLWWRPLLGEQHASLVKAVDLVTQPVEYVLASINGPRHVRRGLGCFTIATDGTRTLPKTWSPMVPLLEVPNVNSIFVDIPAEQLPTFMRKMAIPE